MIVTYDDIVEGGYIIDHKCSSDVIVNWEIDREIELEEGSGDCDDEEGADVDEKETKSQEALENSNQ